MEELEYEFGGDFDIRRPETYSIFEIAQMLGDEIIMIPERKGY